MTAPQCTLTEKVFDRLKAMYGARFLDAWADVKPEEMFRTWSAVVSRFDADTIGKALRELLENNPFPPTLPEFAKLCAKHAPAPAQSRIALPAPDTSAEAKAAREKAAAMLAGMGKARPGLEWARKARARNLSGEHRLTPSELVIVDDALRFEPVEVAA